MLNENSAIRILYFGLFLTHLLAQLAYSREEVLSIGLAQVGQRNVEFKLRIVAACR